MALDSTTIKLYNPDEPFVQCTCCSSGKTSYSMMHADISTPLNLPAELVTSIELLLWYAPNISSGQSFTNEYLDNKSFENAVMTYFLQNTSLAAADILFLNGSDVPQEYILPFKDSICDCCHKMILIKSENETRLDCILRHLRNCIAHGKFNFTSNGEFIGFDEFNGKTKAVFKLKIQDIGNFCMQLIKHRDFTIAQIVCFSLAKKVYYHFNVPTSGYNWTTNDVEELVFIKSKQKEFAVRFNCSRYQKTETFDSIEMINEYQPGFDNSDFTNETKYIDVYYCKNGEFKVKKVEEGKYLMSKKGLQAFAEGEDLEELLKKAI